jgi:phosphoglycerate dehydrogenase-like enzyme
MKQGAYFIAVSRGKTYDANALVKALDDKRLAGAGLDVTDPEPLPKGHPLWKFDNVVITPHPARLYPPSRLASSAFVHRRKAPDMPRKIDLRLRLFGVYFAGGVCE